MKNLCTLLISLLQVTLCFGQTAEEYLQSGNSKYGEGDFPGALSDYSKAIDLDPSAEAYYYRGLTNSDLEKYEDAIKDFTMATSIKGDYIEAFYYKAYIELNVLYKENEGYADFGTATRIAISADDFIGYYYQGLSYYYLAQQDEDILDDSMDDFDQAIKLNPKYGEAYFARGLVRNRQKDFNWAIYDFTEAIKIYPEYAEAYYERGFNYYLTKEYDKAISDFDHAISINSGNVPYIWFHRRGLSKYAKDDYAEARLDFSNAININNSNNIDPYIKRGDANFMLTDYSDAINDYTEAINSVSDLAEVYFKRGKAYFANREYDAAITDFTSAIKIYPNYFEAYTIRGEVKSNVKKFKEAVEDFNKAIEINDQYAEAYFERSLAKLMLDQKDSGCKDLAKAEELGYKVNDDIKKLCNN